MMKDLSTSFMSQSAMNLTSCGGKKDSPSTSPAAQRNPRPRENAIRFTPVQVEAIRSGVNPGLTMVVGPPGTGKTDTAVQAGKVYGIHGKIRGKNWGHVQIETLRQSS